MVDVSMNAEKSPVKTQNKMVFRFEDVGCVIGICLLSQLLNNSFFTKKKSDASEIVNKLPVASSIFL